MNRTHPLAALIPFLVALALPLASGADPAVDPSPTPAWQRALDNEVYKLSFDVRARLEVADRDDLETSQAWTLRTRVGLGTKPFHGVSGYAELTNTLALNEGGLYWNVVDAPNGRTPVADPTDTDLNRLWLRYQNQSWGGLDLKAGRQRIVLDDARFVGNVGWRQNEQTFDAVSGSTSFGVGGLTATYAYLWDVRRIFGDQGPPGTRDFDSDSHLVNLRYAGLPFGATLTGFATLLDFDDSPGNSSNSYGLRLSGDHPLGDAARLLYSFSYAFQTDAGDNPVSYTASYLWAELGVALGTPGTFKLGYELLGSDDGRARFVTPLATAHKFNGFADLFLNNGGPDGLQDLFVSFAPALPWELTGAIVYHHFWSDEGSESLGDEVDFVIKRSFGRWELLAKGGYFFGDASGLPDTLRTWLQVTFRY